MAYSTISKPGLHFNTKLYAGNGSVRSITGVGFQPDFTWIKSRSSNSHRLTDSVRGATKVVYSDLNFTEATESGITSFDSDGFSLGTNADSNGSTQNFVSWNWKAGTTGSGNTTGSGTYKTYSYSVNTTNGFSVVKYGGNATSGHTIPHHLGAAPKWVIIKKLDGAARSWVCHHDALDTGKVINLDTTDAANTLTTAFNSTNPSSTVITLGTSDFVNGNGNTYVAYCFAEKQGYSKFGSYNGNGSSDGPFVYTGFKPAWIMGKTTNNAGNWFMWDNKRPNEFNLVDSFLEADNSATEYLNNSNHSIDILSNGFKFRGPSGSNVSGRIAIYMAFAEEPLVANVGAKGIPATAR